MSETRLLYNHVVDSLPDKQVRDAIRSYVEELEQQNNELFSNLCMAMDNDRRKLYKEEILKTIEKYK